MCSVPGGMKKRKELTFLLHLCIIVLLRLKRLASKVDMPIKLSQQGDG
jgi:hypothetical protein